MAVFYLTCDVTHPLLLEQAQLVLEFVPQLELDRLALLGRRLQLCDSRLQLPDAALAQLESLHLNHDVRIKRNRVVTNIHPGPHTK